MKKGQITIFIILGIVIVIIIGGAVYFTSTKNKVHSNTPSIATDYVNSCLNKVTSEGIYLATSQGGYLNPKGDAQYGENGDGEPVHYYFQGSILPYVLNGDKITLREFPTRLVEKYIEAELPKCLKWNFPGYEIKIETPEVSIITRDAGTAVSANYPIRFSKEDEAFTIEKFSANLPLRAELLEETARTLLANIASAHTNSTPYALFQHCEEYKSNDNLINIYSTVNPYAADYAVSIVDAMPVRYGMTPLRYQFAVRNVLFGGLCVG